MLCTDTLRISYKSVKGDRYTIFRGWSCLSFSEHSIIIYFVKRPKSAISSKLPIFFLIVNDYHNNATVYICSAMNNPLLLSEIQNRQIS